ncbi:MAG TPA: hypothetical protein HPP97_04620 [Desulfuromonadales bacterium]|nr:hypothetical protein [Desulfuromonadales bacterium]
MDYHHLNSAQNINYRKSVFLLAGIAALLYTLLLMRGKNQPYLAVAATLLAVLSKFEAWPLRKTVDLLIGFGNFMHKLTNPLLFGLIYVVAVVPTALVLKLCGKEILHLRYNNNTASYWQDRSDGKAWLESFRKQY